ncbi:hypothetical protein ACFL1I_07590 [Candidatus Omnitrophota bacterium]
MAKNSFGRTVAVLLFFLLLIGAAFSMQRLTEDINSGKYFTNLGEFRYEAGFLASYLLIIILLLRYGYYLAINRVHWGIVKNDFLFLLNKKYFSRTQWVINILLFWLSLGGFIYSLAISAMKGNL